MTPEQLDKACAREAGRLVNMCEAGYPFSFRIAETAARLAREGWTPSLEAVLFAMVQERLAIPKSDRGPLFASNLVEEMEAYLESFQ